MKFNNTACFLSLIFFSVGSAMEWNGVFPLTCEFDQDFDSGSMGKFIGYSQMKCGPALGVSPAFDQDFYSGTIDKFIDEILEVSPEFSKNFDTGNMGNEIDTSNQLHEIHEKKFLVPLLGVKAISKKQTKLEKKYECTWLNCKRNFTNRRDFMNHERTHTGEKPFACGWEGCGFKSAQKSSVKRHVLIHTGKPFECKYCQKKYSSSNYHKQHESNCIGTMIDKSSQLSKYECSWCQKRCLSKRDLINHERIHTGEKPFACGWPGCVFKSAQKSSVKSHEGRCKFNPSN